MASARTFLTRDLPLSVRALNLAPAWALLAFAWLFAGLFWREPWKADEGYSFGIVLSMIRDGSLLVPTLAGEPFLEKPPLVFWLAAAMGSLFEPLLPLHAASRLANALLVMATFGVLGMAARRALGPSRVAPALLWLAACPAWFVASRYLTADLGLMLGAAMAVNGLVRLQLALPRAGVWLGLAATVGLLSKGLLLPGALGMALAGLLLFSAPMRRRATLVEFGWAALVAAPLMLAWPLALWLQAPELFDIWFWDNNIGRFLGHNRLAPPNDRLRLLIGAALYLLPVWPAAALALRLPHRRPVLLGPALFAAALLGATAASALMRIGYLLPVFVPLCFLAAAWQPRLAPGLGRRLSALILGGLLVLLAGTLVLKGSLWGFQSAPRWWAPEGITWPMVVVSLLAGFGAWRLARQGRLRDPLAAWVVSLTVIGCTVFALFLKPADQTTGYREVLTELGLHLPRGVACVASRGLGESERGLLQYYAGVVTLRVETDPESEFDCPVLIEQGRQRAVAGAEGLPEPCQGMQVLWEGARPEDGRDVFRICVGGADEG